MRYVVRLLLFLTLLTHFNIVSTSSETKKSVNVNKNNPVYRVAWSDYDKNWLLMTFNRAWQHAIEKGELNSSVPKPVILFDEAYSSDFLAVAENKHKLIFYSSFIFINLDEKLLTINHEIGHYNDGDFRALGGVEYAQRECTADVFAGKVLGCKFVLALLKKRLYGAGDLVFLYTMANHEAIKVLQGKKTRCSLVTLHKQ